MAGAELEGRGTEKNCDGARCLHLQVCVKQGRGAAAGVEKKRTRTLGADEVGIIASAPR
jgi:hypothetical protein